MCVVLLISQTSNGEPQEDEEINDQLEDMFTMGGGSVKKPSEQRPDSATPTNDLLAEVQLTKILRFKKNGFFV